MKLTLIHPCVGRIPGKDYIRSWQMEPLPPAYLAALTPPDVTIEFYDDRLEQIPFDRQTDLVALSVETYTARRAYQIATEYRRRGVPVVMGGFHPTLMPQEVARHADAVVVGEAEQLWPRVVENFRAGQLQRLYRASARPAMGRVTPDRRIFAGKRYLAIGLIEASRGCTFKCEFCAVTSFFNATQGRRDTAAIVDEIRSLKQSKRLFFFVDDNIAAHPTLAKEFYRALIPLKIKWVSQATITMTHDDEMMQLMRASGCQGVLIGFESLNPANLATMNKSFNTAQGGYERALAQLRRYRLRLYATFIFGYDQDSTDSFTQAVAFCRRHKIFMAAFNHLTPFPGTPLYHRLADTGQLLYNAWWLDPRYRYGQTPFRAKLGPEMIQAECVRARKRFYSLGSILRRMFSWTNCSNPTMFGAFWFINLLLRKEATQRENYPLGDESFQGDFLMLPPLPDDALTCPAAAAETTPRTHFAGSSAPGHPVLLPVV